MLLQNQILLFLCIVWMLYFKETRFFGVITRYFVGLGEASRLGYNTKHAGEDREKKLFHLQCSDNCC